MLIIGLGNPGIRYRWTRHNAGFIFLERLAKKYKKKFFSQPGYKQAGLEIGDKEIKLIKPLLLMNRSGLIVERLLKESFQDFLVVLDDINLPIGRLRMRARGSDGGHKGLRSIIQSLKTEDFPRLRIGIANSEITERKIDPVEFVLSPFERGEKKIIEKIIDKGIEGIEILISHGFEKAQNFINSTSFHSFLSF